MKLVVLLEIGADVCIPPELDPRSGRVRGEWLVRQPDPASGRALALALELAAAGGAEVTVVHLGPPSADAWLRRALAGGADAAVRVWSDELAGVGAAGKAVVLAEAARALGAELVLAGACGVLDGSGALGVLLAERLSVPCVTQAESVALDQAKRAAEVTRTLEQGYRERVAAPLPLVVTVAPPAGDGGEPPQPTAAARLRAEAAAVPVWDLADLGVPAARLRAADEALQAGPPVPARPRLHPVAGPDPSLPAFERILKLVEGSVKRREGRVVRRPAEQVVEEIFGTLRAEGWLDHLRPGWTGADFGGEARR